LIVAAESLPTPAAVAAITSTANAAAITATLMITAASSLPTAAADAASSATTPNASVSYAFAPAPTVVVAADENACTPSSGQKHKARLILPGIDQSDNEIIGPVNKN
jgi:hypothetical protein